VGRTWGLPAAASDLQASSFPRLIPTHAGSPGAPARAGPRRGRHELLDGAGGGPRVPAAAHPVDGGRGAAAQRRLHLPQPAQRLQQRRRAPHAPRHGAVPPHISPPPLPLSRRRREHPAGPRPHRGASGLHRAGAGSPLPSKDCYVSVGKKEKKFIVQSASFVPNYTHTLDNINRGTGPAVRFPCDRQGWKMLVPQSRATSPCFHQHIQRNIGLGSIHIYILI
uniref:Uncharacterized protein n=1 Tax=Aquila chrysaetos chrysaetos TaxID=223781 RepID=A0A663F9W4_AQUCH